MTLGELNGQRQKEKKKEIKEGRKKER